MIRIQHWIIGVATVCLAINGRTETTEDPALDYQASTIEDDGSTLTTTAVNMTTTELQETTTELPETTAVTYPTTVTVETLPARLTNYVYEVGEGNLQDITAEESSNHYLNFESKRYKPTQVEVTSFVADSDATVRMDVEEAVEDIRRRSEGADMISAFFVAPEDEVHENILARKKAQERRDLKESPTTILPPSGNSLSDEVLAPLRAAVSLSHGRDEKPHLEKQTLKEMPVYKTYIEIQKSIPYELKADAPKEEPPRPQNQQQGNSDLLSQLVYAYQYPQYRSPVYYRYPMYYVPQSYIGNYIMQHSHENLGAYGYRPRPYYYIRYQPQVYNPLLYNNYYNEMEVDQNALHSEPAPGSHQQHRAPFRPSQPVFTSVYPPHTYKVLSTMTDRGPHARSTRSKQLCIEYGGFKPPMVPSVQLDESELPIQHNLHKSSIGEKSD